MPTQTIKRSMAQRRALIAECKRRMEAGEETKSIYTSLQIPRGTFYKWAKIHGFRRGDVQPGHPHARTRTHAGPSAGTSSGRYMRGEGLGRPRSGGRQPILSPEEAARFIDHPAEAHLEALRARDREDFERVDAICRLFKKQKSREGELEKLEKIAQTDPNYRWDAYFHDCMQRWEMDETYARMAFRVIHDLDRTYVEPPLHKRPPQDWIDFYAPLADVLLQEGHKAGCAKFKELMLTRPHPGHADYAD